MGGFCQSRYALADDRQRAARPSASPTRCEAEPGGAWAQSLQAVPRQWIATPCCLRCSNSAIQKPVVPVRAMNAGWDSDLLAIEQRAHPPNQHAILRNQCHRCSASGQLVEHRGRGGDADPGHR